MSSSAVVNLSVQFHQSNVRDWISERKLVYTVEFSRVEKIHMWICTFTTRENISGHSTHTHRHTSL